MQRASQQPRWCLAVAATIIAVSMVSATLRGDEPGSAILFGDRVTSGKLVGWDPAAGFRFREAQATDDMASQDAREIVSYGEWNDSHRGPLVILTDGSRIPGSFDSPANRRLEVEPFSPAIKTLSLDATVVRAVCYDPPRDPATRDRWLAKILQPIEEHSEHDALHLQDGSVVYGTVEPSDEENTIRFSPPQVRKAEKLALTKIRAIVWSSQSRPATEPKPGDIWLGLPGGLLLRARGVETGHTIEAGESRLACGVEFEPQAKEFTPTFVRADPATTVRLQRLEPLGFRHQPWIGEPGQFEAVDETIAKTSGRLPIRTRHALWFRGIRQPSASRLAYALPEFATHFVARIGVEDVHSRRPAPAKSGGVKFRVFGGSGDSWQPLYESELLVAGDRPVPVAVPLKEATRIALVVDMADGNDTGDHAVWIDPFVTLSRDPRRPMNEEGNR